MIATVIVLLLAVPIGYLLAWLTRDEIKPIRKWIEYVTIAGFAFAGGFYVYGFLVYSLTCLFVAIVSFVSYMKSFDDTWTK